MKVRFIYERPKEKLFSRKALFILLLFLSLKFYAQEKSPAIKIGDPAPPLHLEALLQAPKEFKGTWEDLKGKIVVIEFWATWCDPCRAAMPHLNELVNEYKNKPVQFISITDEEEWRVKNFLTVTPILGWIGLDGDDSMFKAFGFSTIPQTVLIDQKGKVAIITSPNELNSSTLDKMLAGISPALVSNQNTLAPETSETKQKIEEHAEQPLLELVIRPAKPSIYSSFSGGTFKARGMNLSMLISYAYEISPVRVIAVNQPAVEEAYEITARVPEERSDLLRPMLQQALNVAFGLKVWRETKEMDVLILSMPKNGRVQLHPSLKESEWGIMSDNGLISSSSTTILNFSKVLENVLNKIVLDETHLEGLFDLALYWDPKAPESAIEAIRKQLGLELRTEKRSIEILFFETKSASSKK